MGDLRTAVISDFLLYDFSASNWLKGNKRVMLHYTPTSSTWLNLVEWIFSVLTEHQLKRGIFTSVDELEQKIIANIDNNNNMNPKFFVWTKSAEEKSE